MKPGLGVGVMVLKENKILLGVRNPDKIKASSELQGQGTWTMPGGKVEFMETLVDAAKRELLEETGYEVEDIYELEWHYQDQGCGKAIIRTYVATGCKKIRKQD